MADLTPPPKLVEQLKLLREEYGEGFDEDIAQPLALIVQTVRDATAPWREAHESELEGVREECAALEHSIEEMRDTEGVFADLEDLRRGVIVAEEMYEKWLDKIPALV